MILDVHTHAPLPRPEAVGAFEPETLPPENLFPGQLLSCGIHPWSLEKGDFQEESLIASLRKQLSRNDVVALGECGIDIPRGGLLAMQRILFRRQAELAEEFQKPLIIHCVKAHEHILALHSELKPEQPWAIHGFRGKPAVAEMFVRRGIRLGFGPLFNPETLRMMPEELILCETDDSGRDIEEVISSLEEARGCCLRSRIAANTAAFLK